MPAMAILYGLLFCSFSASAMYLSGLIPLAFVFEIVLCASLTLMEPSDVLEDPPRAPSALRASLCCATIGFRMDCLRVKSRTSVSQPCWFETGQEFGRAYESPESAMRKLLGRSTCFPYLRRTAGEM